MTDFLPWPLTANGTRKSRWLMSPAERVCCGNSTMVGAYRYLIVPMHPSSHEAGRVAEHRVVAERKLGRLLRPGEVVHHINGDPVDNRPENLVVCGTASIHQRLHRKAA